MNTDKDYYAILGVLPSADAVVIKAAYKALAQRYHPDKYDGDQDSSVLMAELNEAYKVLSNPSTRKEYDDVRGHSTQEANDSSFEQDGDSDSYDPLKEEWDIAVEFYPELEASELMLRKISWKLSNAYKAHLLATKEFSRGDEIEKSMRKEFLQMFFGKDIYLLDFATKLIFDGNRDAALKLNKIIRAIGSERKSDIIKSIIIEFNLGSDYRFNI